MTIEQHSRLAASWFLLTCVMITAWGVAGATAAQKIRAELAQIRIAVEQYHGADK